MFEARPQNTSAVVLAEGADIITSHHQKFLVVKGNNTAFAFCGGVDINPDRRDSPNHGAEGAFHDVHAKIEGPAVIDVLNTFIERWRFLFSNFPPDTPLNTPLANPSSMPFQPNAGKYVCAGCSDAMNPESSNPFFSSEHTPLDAFIRAINKAKKFIYIEDQYFTPYPGTDPNTAANDTVGVLTALRAALPVIDYLIIVIPNHTDQPQGRFRRQQVIQSLKSLDQSEPHKVHVFYLGRQGPHASPEELATEGGGSSCSGGNAYRQEIYCHTKSWIVDDICAKIGSCNCNRRGFKNDSEMDIVVIDGALDNGSRKFALDYRLDLWGEHLNMNGARKAILSDYKIALSFWLHPPAGARIREYRHNEEIDIVNTQIMWDSVIDPGG